MFCFNTTMFFCLKMSISKNIYKINIKNFIYTYFIVLQSFILNIFVDRRNDFIVIRCGFEELVKILTFVAKHSTVKANMLLDIAVVDLPGKLYRFNINYLLNSVTLNQRFVVLTFSNEIT